jgi:hypothetical protein
MTDDPTDRRFADAVRGISRTTDGAARQRAQESRRADELVRLTHETLCELVASAAAELRSRNVPSDTGRREATGRGWELPGLGGLWIAWDGSAYSTDSDPPLGKSRSVRFDSRRVPRNLFELPSWVPEEGGTRHRVIIHHDRLVVSPGGQPFEPVLGAAVDARARLG